MRLSKSPRLYKDVANYAIFETIRQIMWDREVIQGEAENVIWLKTESHKFDKEYKAGNMEAIPINFKINIRSDELAEEGREGEFVKLRFPVHNLAKAVLMIDDTFVESGTQKAIYRELEKTNLELVKSKKDSSPRLEFFDFKGIWQPLEGKGDGSSIQFEFKLNFRCMSTERNIQIANEHLGKLYPGYLCCLCKQKVGDEYHALCECSCLREIRAEVFQKGTKKLAKILTNVNNGSEYKFTKMEEKTLQQIIFPAQKKHFKYGGVPNTMKMFLTHRMPGFVKIDMQFKKVKNIMMEMYKDMWNYRGDKVQKKELTLAHRLKTEYKMSLWDLRRTYKTLQDKHKKWVKQQKENKKRADGAEVVRAMEGIDLNNIAEGRDMEMGEEEMGGIDLSNEMGERGIEREEEIMGMEEMRGIDLNNMEEGMDMESGDEARELEITGEEEWLEDNGNDRQMEGKEQYEARRGVNTSTEEIDEWGDTENIEINVDNEGYNDRIERTEDELMDEWILNEGMNMSNH